MAVASFANVAAALADSDLTAWWPVWVTVGRMSDEPRSVTVGVAAAVAAVVVLGLALTGRRGVPVRQG